MRKFYILSMFLLLAGWTNMNAAETIKTIGTAITSVNQLKAGDTYILTGGGKVAGKCLTTSAADGTMSFSTVAVGASTAAVFTLEGDSTTGYSFKSEMYGTYIPEGTDGTTPTLSTTKGLFNIVASTSSTGNFNINNKTTNVGQGFNAQPTLFVFWTAGDGNQANYKITPVTLETGTTPVTTPVTIQTLGTGLTTVDQLVAGSTYILTGSGKVAGKSITTSAADGNMTFSTVAVGSSIESVFTLEGDATTGYSFKSVKYDTYIPEGTDGTTPTLSGTKGVFDIVASSTSGSFYINNKTTNTGQGFNAQPNLFVFWTAGDGAQALYKIVPVTLSGTVTPVKKDSVTLTIFGSTYKNDTFVESVGSTTIKVEKGSTYTFPATIQFGTTTYNVGTVTYQGSVLGPYGDAQLNNVAVGATITLTADASYSAYLILSDTPAKKDSVTLSIEYYEYKTDKSTQVGKLTTIETKVEKGSIYVIPATISYNGKTYNLSVITSPVGSAGPIYDTGSGKTLAVGTSIVMTQDSAMFGYVVEAVDHFTGTVSYQNAADGTDLQTATTLTIKPGDTYTIPTTVTIDGKSYTIESADVNDTEATVGSTITPTSDFTVLLICKAVVTDGIDAAETTKTAVYYDLQGRRIMNPTHGVFIVNGKKVVK